MQYTSYYGQSLLALSTVILTLARSSIALPLTTVPSLSFSLLHTVPGTQTLENLALRQSGDILVTSVTSNSLYQVSHDNSSKPTTVATIPGVSGLLGIAELQTDVFYVVGSRIAGLTAEAGSNAVWRVDLRESCPLTGSYTTADNKVTLVAQFEDALLFNGMTRLAEDDSANLLLADSVAGTVTKLNVYTGEHEIIIRDPSMDPQPGGLGLGINGIHVYGDTLYYTSLDLGTFVAMPICPETGLPTGPADVIARGISVGDDFVLFEDGKKALIANNGEFTLTLVDIARKSASIAANSTLLDATTAVAFAHSRHGPASLYVTGASKLNGNTTIGAVISGHFRW